MSQNFEVNLAFRTEMNEALRDIQNLRRELDNLAYPNTRTTQLGISEELIQAQREAQQLSAILRTSIDQSTGRLNLTRFASELQASGKSLESYRIALSSIGSEGMNAFNSLTQQLISANTEINNSSKVLNDLWTTLKNTVRWEITTAAVKAFSGAISEAFDYAEDLNKSLTQIQIVTGNSSEQMAEFAKQANRMAKL